MEGKTERMLPKRLSEAIRRRFPSVSVAARRAGISAYILRDWCSGKRRPRPFYFWRTLDRLGIPRKEFDGLVPPSKPSCGYCRKPIADSSRYFIRATDHRQKEISHLRCRRQAKESWREVRCVSCSSSLFLSPSRIRQLKWKKEKNGILYRVCGRCASRRRAATALKCAHKAVLSELWQERPNAIERYYGRAKQHMPKEVEWALQRLRANFAAIEQDAETRNLLLRERLRAITPEGWNRGRSGPGPHRRSRLARRTGLVRPAMSVIRVAKADLDLDGFKLCPICGLVVYVSPRQSLLARFHKPCAEFFKQTPAYRQWRGSRAQKVSAPYPFPEVKRERGRPKDASETLYTHYQWLMASACSLGGTSLRRLALSQGLAVSTVHEGIAAFIELLPGSWDLVFQYKGSRPNRTRQTLVSLPTHRGDQTALILQLIGRGMLDKDIATLTGVPLPRVQVLAQIKEKSA